jgi:hypothetical protein
MAVGFLFHASPKPLSNAGAVEAIALLGIDDFVIFAVIAAKLITVGSPGCAQRAGTFRFGSHG